MPILRQVEQQACSQQAAARAPHRSFPRQVLVNDELNLVLKHEVVLLLTLQGGQV